MSSSGASTPRGALTPPPPGDGPSPLMVGTRFVKQYYKVLSTSPNQIHRFYQPTSFLSQGKGSQPTQPELFESVQQIHLKERFVLEGYEECPIRFEFERGAIDAQVSVNGGVLLVVTGHLVYLRPAVAEDEEVVQDDNDESLQKRRKAFVHTFFLGSISSGQKRSYYVHNDILRFLNEDDESIPASAPVPAPVTVPTKATKAEKKVAPLKVAELEPKVEAAATATTNGVEAHTKASGGGVEETKEREVKVVAAVAAATTATKEPEVVTTPVKEKKAPGGGVEESKEVTPEGDIKTATGTLQGAEKLNKPKPPPGSWASLVARAPTSASSTPTPGTPSRAAPAPKVSPVPAAPAAAKPKPVQAAPAPTGAESKPDNANNSKANANTTTRTMTKRDPDCTLVIKNIDAATTEPDVIGLFGPFAAETDSKIVGITVSANRGIAFVDYDAAAPVLKAVEQHGKEPMQIRGRVLDMYQKTLEQRGRRGGGGGGQGQGGRGGYRGGGQQDGGYRGGGGGRQQYRGGRGGRGGRGDGRGGDGGRGGRAGRS